MRVRNPKRFERSQARFANVCACEHDYHMTDEYKGYGVVQTKIRVKHKYLRRPSGQAWALYVGHVCDDCAATCMKDWIVEEHVCGTGDCRRQA
jgi:hypothetical protein